MVSPPPTPLVLFSAPQKLIEQTERLAHVQIACNTINSVSAARLSLKTEQRSFLLCLYTKHGCYIYTPSDLVIVIRVGTRGRAHGNEKKRLAFPCFIASNMCRATSIRDILMGARSPRNTVAAEYQWMTFTANKDKLYTNDDIDTHAYVDANTGKNFVTAK